MFRNTMVIILTLSFLVALHAQQFLQLETINDPESKKFSIGESIFIKTITNDEWHKITLKEFLYKDSIILIDEGYLKTSDITHVKDTRPVVYALSKAFQTFGAGYIVYGVIGSFSDRGDKFSVEDALIGSSAIAVGWAFKKAFYIREYKMGKRYRLRLMDLRIRLSE